MLTSCRLRMVFILQVHGKLIGCSDRICLVYSLTGLKSDLFCTDLYLIRALCYKMHHKNYTICKTNNLYYIYIIVILDRQKTLPSIQIKQLAHNLTSAVVLNLKLLIGIHGFVRCRHLPLHRVQYRNAVMVARSTSIF